MSPKRITGGWSIRLRFGADQRLRLRMPDHLTPARAKARACRLERMAQLLASSGKHVEARALLPKAAAASSEQNFSVAEKLARETAAEAPQAREQRIVRFRDVCEQWLTGELHERYPRHVGALEPGTVEAYRCYASTVCDIVGNVPVAAFTLEHAEEVVRRLPETTKRAKTVNCYVLMMKQVLEKSVYPLKLIEHCPIPAKFVPGDKSTPAFPFLYPDEDEQLMRCTSLALPKRLLYGFLGREGCRYSEAKRLTRSDLDLERGVLTLNKNKTRVPRAWKLGDDVLAAFRIYLADAQGDDLVFPEAGHRCKAAQVLREDLLKAGLDRRELHMLTPERRPMRVHDLRGTFVTLALANGKTETWVMDRTGHKSSKMVNTYRRQARHAAEVELGWFKHLGELLGLVEASEGPGGVGHGVGQVVRIPAKIAVGYKTARCAPAPAAGVKPRKKRPPKRPAAAENAGGPAEIAGVGHGDGIEEALAEAVRLASQAGRWDVVTELSRELAERRRVRTAPEVPSLDDARRRKGGK